MASVPATAIIDIYRWLVGGLEHDFDFSIQLGISSSQLTNSIIFQRGRLNHQPDVNLPEGITIQS